MAKTKENIRKKHIDFLVFLKSISKWITNKKRQDEQLEYLIDKYKIENSIVKRIISYNYNFPYIIKYFNRYFNNLYEFDSFDTKLLIKSIVYLMDINNRSDSKYFTYIKNNELKDEIKSTIKELIKEYLSITYDIDCNKKELNFYYKLFKIGYITDEDLLIIDRHLNGENTKIKSLESINFSQAINISNDIENINIELNSKMIDFINSEFKQKKPLRSLCQKCELFRKSMIVFDTNCDDFGDIDIMFIGLAPNEEDVKQDKPFIGESSKEIRKIINKLNKDIKWCITNNILCTIGNKKDITNLTKVKENCEELVNKIFEKFNSKYYIPIGDETCRLFGIEDKITFCSGKIYDLENGSKIIPLIHPNVISKNSKYQSIFETSVKNILNCFNNSSNTPARASSAAPVIEIEKEKFVSDVKNLLLVDIKRLENNKILMIYTDLDGNKKYEIKDFKIPIYIKNKNWNECLMITDKVDDVCWVNDYEKTKISQKCHAMIKEMH